jgi:hypothetical protein
MRALMRQSFVLSSAALLMSLAWTGQGFAQANRPDSTGYYPRPEDRFRPPPLHTDPNVQRTLAFTQEQINRLRQIHSELGLQYEKELSGHSSLDEQQRSARLRELSTTYRTNTMRSVGEILTPKQMTRYRQLDLQQRRLAAMSDPEVRKRLNLTDDQARRLQALADRYNRELAALHRSATTEAAAAEAVRRYEKLRNTTQEQLIAILNENQRKLWQEMTGEPFTFRVEFRTNGPSEKGTEWPRP